VAAQEEGPIKVEVEFGAGELTQVEVEVEVGAGERTQVEVGAGERTQVEVGAGERTQGLWADELTQIVVGGEGAGTGRCGSQAAAVIEDWVEDSVVIDIGDDATDWGGRKDAGAVETRLRLVWLRILWRVVQTVVLRDQCSVSFLEWTDLIRLGGITTLTQMQLGDSLRLNWMRLG
jgi:hypothetical protein